MLQFLIPGKAKLILGLVLALAVASAVGYHYFTVNRLNKQIAVMTVDLQTAITNQAKLEAAIATQTETIDTLKRQRKIDQEKLNQLDKQYRASRKDVSKLRKLLSDHDIGYLMLRKPGLMENIMNRGTDKFGREIEELTGGGSE